MATCLALKPSLLCWALWAHSPLKQSYTRTCVTRAACCIWCALKQFIGAISIVGSKSSAPELQGTWGILLGSWTHWWITFLLKSVFPLGMTVCVTPLTTLFAKAPESPLIIPRHWMEVLRPDGDSQMITSRIRRSECVFGLWREVRGTQPPGPLINKFMYEEERKFLWEGFQSVVPPSLLLSHFHCERQNKITPRQWIIRKFMKRDECDGALHEIPMREAPQRSKCYILISTVTLCYSLCSPEGHIMDRAA